MSKSICIKTNNKKDICYLLNKLETIKLDNTYYSKCKFSKFTNIIVHYKGKQISKFISIISQIISSCIIDNYEKSILKHILSNNYFYFSEIEQSKILNICIESINSNTLNIYENLSCREKEIEKSLKEYLSMNKSLILTGFINFRIGNYIKILDLVLDNSVNKFVVDREYTEFINLLKAYVNSKEYGLNVIHLIYTKQESILLDEFKDTINLENTVLNAKYISDISFSSNDYALNNLLTLLPKTIYIHLVDSYEDEFINTLKLIFGNRICICKDCDICKLYSIEKMTKK